MSIENVSPKNDVVLTFTSTIYPSLKLPSFDSLLLKPLSSINIENIKDFSSSGSSGTLIMFIWDKKHNLIWKGYIPSSIKKTLTINPDIPSVNYLETYLSECPDRMPFVNKLIKKGTSNKYVWLCGIIVCIGILLYRYYKKK